jgi:putative addiction module component (TIGR02574 family)
LVNERQPCELDKQMGSCEHRIIKRTNDPCPSWEVAMTRDGGSVFDLSPSEKLQLVEDLWDDLAASPETVPVHNWQKEELARRKANLLSRPASGLSWEEVRRRVRSRYGR